jgi:hypothetical protein
MAMTMLEGETGSDRVYPGAVDSRLTASRPKLSVQQPALLGDG